MKHLITFGKVTSLIHNGKLISIKLKVNIKEHKGKTIIFKDSFLMLPISLRNLSKTFNVELSLQKTYFPYLLNNINYNGIFPKFEYWTDISKDKWIELKNEHGNKTWNFKNESIKYCEQDCISLHEVLSKFSNLIYNKYKIDPIKCLTLPALAMKIWKTQYMPTDSIYQINGLVD